MLATLDMSRLKINIDAEAISSLFGEIKDEVEKDLYDATEALARRTEAKVRELAAEKLNSTFDIFTSALEFQEIQKGLYVIELDEKALWVEDGRKSGSMVDDLLRKNAKTSKSGEKYKVIPFKHDKNPSQQTVKAKAITQMVKAELKKRNIPYKKLELDKTGNPRLGMLHALKNISSPKPSKNAKYGALDGLAIYQRKDAKGKVKRDIMTFRVVKESHKNEGLWEHPGLEGAHIFEEAYDWAVREFDQMLGEIYSQYKK